MFQCLIKYWYENAAVKRFWKSEVIDDNKIFIDKLRKIEMHEEIL